MSDFDGDEMIVYHKGDGNIRSRWKTVVLDEVRGVTDHGELMMERDYRRRLVLPE